jgi:hypothetical protein
MKHGGTYCVEYRSNKIMRKHGGKYQAGDIEREVLLGEMSRKKMTDVR